VSKATTHKIQKNSFFVRVYGQSFPKSSSLHQPTYTLSDISMDTPDSFFVNDAWAQEAGIELLEVSAGRAKVRLRIAGWHKNSHGTVHGGAIFTLADTAFALASNSHGIPASAINAHIFYVKAATSGILYAVAEEFSVNPKIATYTVTVTDDRGEKIALFEGMVYRKTPGR
jgi:acyl-CoA thioesterase